MNTPLLIVTGIGLFFSIVWLLKCLWNMTMPVVFNLKAITYWQAFRLLLIAAILFGGKQSKWEGKQDIKKAVQEKIQSQGAIEPSK